MAAAHRVPEMQQHVVMQQQDQCLSDQHIRVCLYKLRRPAGCAVATVKAGIHCCCGGVLTMTIMPLVMSSS